MARAVSMAVMQPTECSTAERRMLEAVGVVLAALGGSVDDQVHGAGGDHIQNVGVGLRDAGRPCWHSMPASWSASQVPEVARSSMPISSKPRAMPTISCLSSSLTVMMIRPPLLGRLQTGPLEGLQQGLREGSRPGPGTSPVDFISGPRPVSTSVSFSKENTGHLDGVVVGLPVDAGAVAPDPSASGPASPWWPDR